MNDRFKFRVWDKKEKRFIDHPQINPLFGCVCGYENSTYPLQIEQCTGRKDKNGKLIYEGDVIKDWRGGVFMVVWLNEQAQFFAESPKCDTDGYFLDDNICFFEIIGNIHEQLEQGE